MKFFEKYYPYIVTAMVAICCLMLFQINCSGLTFTQTSKPVNMGNFNATQGYTINFDFAADTGSHLNRTVTMYEWGTSKVYVQYPYLYFDGNAIPLSGMVNYTKIFNGNPHRWTLRVGVSCKKELLIDSMLIGLQSVNPNQLVNSGAFWMSSNSDIDKLSGTISNFSFKNYYDTLRKEYPVPTFAYDSRNYVKGYVAGDWSNAVSCYQQLVNYPEPKYSAVCPKIHPMFDFYKAGGEDWGIAPDSCTKAGTMIAKILCDKFNCDLRVVGNTQDYWSYKDQPYSPHGKFNNAMIALANSNLSYELRVDGSLSQIDDIGTCKTITTQQFADMLPTEPLTTFDGMACILQTQYTDIQSKLNHPIKYAMIDNEFANKWLDTVKYQNNAGCRAAKEASGLSWRDYCSRQYTNAMNRIYAGVKRACPDIQLIEYDVNCLDECNYYYDAKFSYRIALNVNGMGSEQYYPRSPFWSLMGTGDYRGLLNSYLLNKRGQVKQGHKLSTPFVGVGYTGIPEQDINPTSTLGLETFLIGCGSPTLYPSLYVQGGNNPNPAAYAYQMVSATYAQAANSKAWDIVMNGDLLPGNRNVAWLCYGGTNYTYWAGDYETVVAVKKLGTRYLINCLRGNTSNLKTGQPYKRDFNFVLNGKTLPLNARWQCSTYLYDESKPIDANNPKFLNQWAKFGDYYNWTTDTTE